MKKLFQLDFIPRSADVALLLLRVYFGLSMLWLHGRGKLLNYSKLSDSFPDPVGVGSQASLIFVLLGEVVCPALIIVGAFTRLSTLVSGVTMATAFTMIHGGRLTGTNNGELAFLYLGVFLTLFIAGAGRFSIDAKLGSKR